MFALKSSVERNEESSKKDEWEDEWKAKQWA